MKQHNLDIYFIEYNNVGFRCRDDCEDWGFLCVITPGGLRLYVNGNPKYWIKIHEG